MLDELPDIGDIFNKNEEDNVSTASILHQGNKDIYIFVSKQIDKWIAANFVDIAPSGIGIHVVIPAVLDLSIDDLDNVRIKFEKKGKNSNILLKELNVLVRWQERDPISGQMKLGLHFHGEIKADPEIIEILKQLQASKKE